MSTWKRAITLASTGFVLLALCGSQASAGIQSDPTQRVGTIPPAAVLDPAFSGDGLVTLPGEVAGWTAYGVATSNDGLVVSGGPNLWMLSSSGDPAELFGGAGTLSPPPPAGGEFSLGDLTIDSAGRLLVVGTSFPDGRGPDGPTGFQSPIVPSAIRILRLLPDGTPDSTFGQDGVIETDFGLPPPRDKRGRPLQPEASMESTGIAVDSHGRIVLTGDADVRLGPSCRHDLIDPEAVSVAFVVRLTDNGGLDSSFGRGGVVGGRKSGETPLHAESIGDPVTSPSGAITYRSTAISACGRDHGRSGVAQLTPKGRTRKGLGRTDAIAGDFTALAGTPNGSVFALARVVEGDLLRGRLIRIAPNGKVDRSFGHHGRTVVKLGLALSDIDSLAVDPQDRILLGGTLGTRKGRSMLLVRVSAGGQQEMNFGPNGIVATSFPSLPRFGPEPSGLFFDPRGRVVTMHRYETGEFTGLFLARYLLRN